ncbi:hypothetical protein DPMN_107732 [Dreissena polymorpha]|uniref:Uncharacterized protein n=1 Tax=Dreissena polymorpha TaxID=45954 RepID=A0A9D4K7F5_DREPO|nr:hypothetical protein DPMN_107732 [Dreissena polymorpha]
MTDTGPNVRNIMTSSNAMYLKPSPPVYKKLPDNPQTNINARCSIGASDIKLRHRNPTIPTEFNTIPSHWISSGFSILSTSVLSSLDLFSIPLW